tara:strand:+ start:393 stop:572 length:180 start_codon:yes stop_codon:yes gene_type:complete
MELKDYIQQTGFLIKSSLKLLNEYNFKDIKYDFPNGEQEYPKTIKEAFNKIKRLWRRKL